MGYARKSIDAIGGDVEAEYTWQLQELEKQSNILSQYWFLLLQSTP